MPLVKQKTGRKPLPEVRVQVTVSLPPDLVRRLDGVADDQDRSRSKMVEIVVREYLEMAAA
jgi:metal-responsive CopG/Arc/MetJ family transcriptional regulator